MKKEDEIFRKLDREKPIIRRSARDEEDAYAQPTRRRTAPPEDSAYAQPTRRRTAAPEESAYAQPTRRRTAPPEESAYAQPTRRRTAPPEESAYAQPTRRRTAPPEESAYAQPTRRRSISAEGAGSPGQISERVPRPAPRRESSVQRPDNSARREAPQRTYYGAGDALVSVSDKPANAFSRPYKLAADDRERPELRQRHELKYYLNYGDYTVLRQKMRGLLHIDEHADENGSYYIRSLYYDDIYNTAAVEKMAGSDPRYKYRIRIYNFDKGVIRFEKKIKTGKFISKDSFGMSYEEYLALRDGDIEFLLHKRSPLAKEIYLQMRQSLLRPAVIVDYEREPFVMSYEDIRITFDKNLRTGEPNRDIFDPQLPVMPLMPLNTVIMEVKFQKALPVYIEKVINAAEALQNSAASKYIICRQYD